MSLIQASADAERAPPQVASDLPRVGLGWRFADGWRPVLWCLRGQHLVHLGRA